MNLLVSTSFSRYLTLSQIKSTFFRCTPLVFGSVLVVFVVYKATIIWKEDGKPKGLNLVKVLVQDQILYYIAYASYFSDLL